MSLSSLLVVANASRLVRERAKSSSERATQVLEAETP
jgi:hypothetical protein